MISSTPLDYPLQDIARSPLPVRNQLRECSCDMEVALVAVVAVVGCLEGTVCIARRSRRSPCPVRKWTFLRPRVQSPGSRSRHRHTHRRSYVKLGLQCSCSPPGTRTVEGEAVRRAEATVEAEVAAKEETEEERAGTVAAG